MSAARPRRGCSKVADAENVVFTMNAAHALNIAIRSVVKPGSRVLVSGFEHNSVTRPLRMLTDDITVAGSRLFDEENTLSEFDEAPPRRHRRMYARVKRLWLYPAGL